MKTIFIVTINLGEDEFHYDWNLFATHSEHIAKGFVQKYNKILSKYKEYVSDGFIEYDSHMIDNMYIPNINHATYEEIKIR